MLSLTDLAKALNMDKSNLHKIMKKLNIKGTKMRVVGNRWGIGYSKEDIEKVLEYRKGIPHNF